MGLTGSEATPLEYPWGERVAALPARHPTHGHPTHGHPIHGHPARRNIPSRLTRVSLLQGIRSELVRVVKVRFCVG